MLPARLNRDFCTVGKTLKILSFIKMCSLLYSYLLFKSTTFQTAASRSRVSDPNALFTDPDIVFRNEYGSGYETLILTISSLHFISRLGGTFTTACITMYSKFESAVSHKHCGVDLNFE